MRSLAHDPVLGVAVSRSRRSGGRVPRTWRTSVLQLSDLVEETVLEDEREALEALCFLSAGSCEASGALLATSSLPLPAKQQHSKGSSLTAEAVDATDSKAAAVTSRRHSGRRHSPGSDVSSGGSQGAMLQPQQQLQLPEALPLPLDEIHPGAHPADVDLLVPASTKRKQHATASKKRQLQPHYQQPAPKAAQLLQHQQPVQMPRPDVGLHSGSRDMLASTPAAAHQEMLNTISSSLPLPAILTEQHDLQGQAACTNTLLAAAPHQATVQPAAMGFHQPMLQAQLGPLLQPGSHQLAAAAAAGLSPAHLAALAAAAACGPSLSQSPLASLVQHPQGFPELLAQLMASAGWPAAAALHSAAQPMQPPRIEPVVKRPPAKTCYWHVYIANMIAEGRCKEQQQQCSADAAAVPSVDLAATAASWRGSPSKRQKRQEPAFEQQPAVQAPPPAVPELTSMLGASGGLAPSLAHTLVAAAAAAAVASQPDAVPMIPAAPLSHPLAGLRLPVPVGPSVFPAASCGLPPHVLLQLLGPHSSHGPGPVSCSFASAAGYAPGEPANVLGFPGFAPGVLASMPGAALQQLQAGMPGAAALQQLLYNWQCQAKA